MAMSKATTASTTMTEYVSGSWEEDSYKWEESDTEFSDTELSDPSEP